MSHEQKLGDANGQRAEQVRIALEKQFPTFLGGFVVSFVPGKPGHKDTFSVTAHIMFSRKNFNGLGLTQISDENPRGDYVKKNHQGSSSLFVVNAEALEKALGLRSTEVRR